MDRFKPAYLEYENQQQSTLALTWWEAGAGTEDSQSCPMTELRKKGASSRQKIVTALLNVAPQGYFLTGYCQGKGVLWGCVSGDECEVYCNLCLAQKTVHIPPPSSLSSALAFLPVVSSFFGNVYYFHSFNCHLLGKMT